MRYWSHEEAALLACGFDPRTCPHRDLLRHLDHGARWDAVRRLFDLFRRGRGLPASNIANPCEYLDWASRHDIEFPAALTAAVREGQETHAAVITKPTQRRPENEQREINSLLKILAGIARERYRYDPTDPRSPVPKAIVGDIERAGLQIDDGTVRKYLRVAAEFLD